MFWSFRMFQSEAALARCALFPIVAPVAQQLHTPDVSSGTEGLEHVSGARAARDLGLYLCHAAVDSRVRANEASRDEIEFPSSRISEIPSPYRRRESFTARARGFPELPELPEHPGRGGLYFASEGAEGAEGADSEGSAGSAAA